MNKRILFLFLCKCVNWRFNYKGLDRPGLNRVPVPDHSCRYNNRDYIILYHDCKYDIMVVIIFRATVLQVVEFHSISHDVERSGKK